jgi:hypothetical protein
MVASVKKKLSTNKTRKCYTTFSELGNLLDHELRHLGYIILAKKHGYMDKVIAYKNSCERLKNCIEVKLKITKDGDKKSDLKIMHENICVLLEHVITNV